MDIEIESETKIKTEYGIRITSVTRIVTRSSIEIKSASGTGTKNGIVISLVQDRSQNQKRDRDREWYRNLFSSRSESKSRTG
ncbi:hypothetical protein EVAR_21512_1 [Eumeta japonica]|uniref:Uncharacterized protein n=1 Tax=Eumeta variegata TaxID=151549 RepID=A0A4C1UZ43_EUMVA|nr:hypothetical protein EVAR_21512_1 [Eumeta japonica]